MNGDGGGCGYNSGGVSQDDKYGHAGKDVKMPFNSSFAGVDVETACEHGGHGQNDSRHPGIGSFPAGQERHRGDCSGDADHGGNCDAIIGGYENSHGQLCQKNAQIASIGGEPVTRQVLISIHF